jgi:pilus assembly protein CpaB
MARVQELTMPGGNRTLLLIALLAGAVAAVIVFVAVSNSEDSTDKATSVTGNTVPALVATQSIKAGQEITADMVAVKQVPSDLRITGAFDDSEPVVGEVSKIAIASGEQINSSKIGILVPDKGLPGVVSAGMRGVAVKVDEVTAVGGNLLPGDHVDIVITYRVDDAPGLADNQYILRTETILQNVEVISVAQEAQKPSAGASTTTGEEGSDPAYTSGQIPDDVEEQPDADTLTLALSPADTNRLISSQEYAVRVWAVVRAFGDDTIVDVTPQDIILVEN